VKYLSSTAAVHRYLAAMALGSALLISSVTAWGIKGRDHFAASQLNTSAGFYRDLYGHVPEIQDQELFYHNVGGSVAAARAADIVLLGPSFVSYAAERTTLRRFEASEGKRVYNMSFIGIRGGEFSRQIITRWNIKAPLWVINADDQITHFFSRSLDLTFGPTTVTIPATLHGRLGGYESVASRNLRWRVEDVISGPAPIKVYRSVATGDATIEVNPRYAADNNKEIKFDRHDCHVQFGDCRYCS
jgi:hypothetical protein